MNAERVKPTWIFWVVVILGLLWHIGGSMNYLMQTKPDWVASLPETHRAIIDGRPAWATGGFAVSVFAGLIGCLFLLRRKPSAGLLFMISLLGTFVTMIHTLQVVLSKTSFSVSEIFIMIVLPLVVANFYIGFTFFSMNKNWITS